jgi:hypothetical protein
MKFNICIPRSIEGKAVFWSFSISYLVESGFSSVTYLLLKVGNSLGIVRRGDLR